MKQERKWQISDRPDEDDPDGSQYQLKIINPNVNRPKEVATPEDCWTMDFGQGAKRRFFIYDTSDPPKGKLIVHKPILCLPVFMV